MSDTKKKEPYKKKGTKVEFNIKLCPTCKGACTNDNKYLLPCNTCGGEGVIIYDDR